MEKFKLEEKLTIGVAAYGNVKATKFCIECIKNSIEGNFELILVDDCSPDNNQTKYFFKSVQKEIPNTKVFSFDKNLEYTGSYNCILSQASGNKILTVPNDIYITPVYLKAIFSLAKNIDNFGTLRGVTNFVDNGSKRHNINIDGHIQTINQEELNKFSTKIYEEKKSQYFEEKFLSGDLFLINKEIINKIGIYDNFFYGYFADHDFGIRVRKAGYKLIVAEDAFAYHDQHTNFNYLNDEEKKKKANSRWIKVYENWARFKIKYSLPVNLMFSGINNIPWDEIVKKDTKNIFVDKKDFSKYLI